MKRYRPSINYILIKYFELYDISIDNECYFFPQEKLDIPQTNS